MSLEEIARQRGFSLGTVQGHLVQFIEKGEVDINEFVSADKQKLILDALNEFDPSAGITPVKSRLPEEISYSDIRFVMALKKQEH